MFVNCTTSTVVTESIDDSDKNPLAHILFLLGKVLCVILMCQFTTNESRMKAPKVTSQSRFFES